MFHLGRSNHVPLSPQKASEPGPQNRRGHHTAGTVTTEGADFQAAQKDARSLEVTSEEGHYV